jgi:hypothetical protein
VRRQSVSLSASSPLPLSAAAREGSPLPAKARRSLIVIQRQLGHADLGIASACLRGIDNTKIIHPVHERPAPMISRASAHASPLTFGAQVLANDATPRFQRGLAQRLRTSAL